MVDISASVVKYTFSTSSLSASFIPLTPTEVFFISDISSIRNRINIPSLLCNMILFLSVMGLMLTSLSPALSFVEAMVFFVTSNSPPLTILHIAFAVTKTKRLRFNSVLDATNTICSLSVEKLLILSMGMPLSLNLPKGRSITFIVCICPISVNMQTLPVFLQLTIYLFSASAVSLFLS